MCQKWFIICIYIYIFNCITEQVYYIFLKDFKEFFCFLSRYFTSIYPYILHCVTEQDYYINLYLHTSLRNRAFFIFLIDFYFFWFIISIYIYILHCITEEVYNFYIHLHTSLCNRTVLYLF